jgi:YbbR domain-containing protein
MSWRNLFYEHRWQKLFALGLAVLIWLTVRSTQGLKIIEDTADEARTFRDVPIVVLTSAADLGRYEVNPAMVQVELRGLPNAMVNVSPALIEAYVNLVDLGRTPQTVPVHINPPPGTSVSLVSPVRIVVNRLSEGVSPSVP